MFVQVRAKNVGGVFLRHSVVMRELIFLLVELSMFGTAYQILSVLLVSLFLSHLLELLI